LEVSILFVASSGPKRFSIFHATRHGPLRHEAVLHWRIEFGFIHYSEINFNGKFYRIFDFFLFPDNENDLLLFHDLVGIYEVN
jgi:hypothetical protein